MIDIQETIKEPIISIEEQQKLDKREKRNAYMREYMKSKRLEPKYIEKKKEYQKNYMPTYMKERKEKEPEFKERMNAFSSLYNNKSYNENPEFRLKRMEASKSLYHKYRDAYIEKQNIV